MIKQVDGYVKVQDFDVAKERIENDKSNGGWGIPFYRFKQPKMEMYLVSIVALKKVAKS